jgi:hypothetical protein
MLLFGCGVRVRVLSTVHKTIVDAAAQPRRYRLVHRAITHSVRVMVLLTTRHMLLFEFLIALSWRRSQGEGSIHRTLFDSHEELWSGFYSHTVLGLAFGLFGAGV